MGKVSCLHTPHWGWFHSVTFTDQTEASESSRLLPPTVYVTTPSSVRRCSYNQDGRERDIIIQYAQSISSYWEGIMNRSSMKSSRDFALKVWVTWEALR